MKKENIKTLGEILPEWIDEKEDELQAQVDEDYQQEHEEENQLRDKKQNYAIHVIGNSIRVETYYRSFYATQVFNTHEYNSIDILYHLQYRGYEIITRRL